MTRAAIAPLLLGLPLVVLAARADPPRREPTRDVYRIPPGTDARVARGEPVTASGLPQRVTTRVGRVLEVVNDDDVTHAFGPVALAPGQRWERRYAEAGAFVLACSVYPTADFVIEVAPPDAPGGPSALAFRIAVTAWVVLSAALLGALGGTGTGGPAAMAGGARRAAAAAPGTTLMVAVAWAAARARLVPWDAALAASSFRIWVLDAIAWGVVAGVVLTSHDPSRSARERSAAGRLDTAFAAVVALGATALGLVPAGAWAGAALAVAGAGWLAAAVWTAWHAVEAADERRARRLALVGLALGCAGLPWTAVTPR